MNEPVKQNLVIYKGATYEKYLRWEISPYIYVPISGISNDAPGVIDTVSAHDMPNGWRFFIQSVQGMKEVNTKTKAPKASDYYIGAVTTSSSITMVDTNTTDYTPYVSGGYVVYKTPRDLTNIVGRLYIKDKVDGELLLALDSALLGGIFIDAAENYILIKISHEVTAAIEWTKGVYDLELEDTVQDKVYRPMSGSITVIKEVTV